MSVYAYTPVKVCPGIAEMSLKIDKNCRKCGAVSRRATNPVREHENRHRRVASLWKVRQACVSVDCQLDLLEV
jgi:hypothetical protein